MDLSFFNFFFNLFFLLRLVMTPHVLYVHMTYVYSFSCVFPFTQSYGQEKLILYYDLLLTRRFLLWMHPHPHFHLPLPPHHPYTHHWYWPEQDRSVGGRVTAPRYDKEESNDCIEEDLLCSRPGTATALQVLLSKISVQLAGRCYWEPSLD